MDRILGAIEKARTQGTVEPSSAPRQGVAPAQDSSASSSVTLGKARFFEPDPAHLERHRIVAFSKSNPYCAYFDMLRTQVVAKMDERGWRTLGIVSPTAECGKTTIAINLAVSMCQLEARSVVLVDLDLRRPRVARYLGIPMTKSLNDVLHGDVNIADVVVNPGLRNLYVLPAERPVEKPSELLSSKQMQDLLRNLYAVKEAPLVIIDLPPLLYADDAMWVLPSVDCALMVVGSGMVSTAELEEGLHQIQATKLLGAVMNKSDIELHDYY